MAAAPDLRRKRVLGLGGIAVLVAAAFAASVGFHGRAERVSACAVLPRGELTRLVGDDVGGASPFVPDGDASGASGCSYGGNAGVRITVFAIAPGGGRFLRSQQAVLKAHDVEQENLSRDGYEAYKTLGPRENSLSVVVLKNDTYVNLVVYDAPTGTAERLAAIAASHVD